MGDRTLRQRKTLDSNVRTSSENVEPTAKTAGWTVFFYIFVTLLSSPIVYVAYVLLFVPAPFEVKEIRLPEPRKWTGVLATNTELQRTQRLFLNEIHGPESLLYDEGHIYASAYDGRVVHIENGVMRNLVSFGTPPCGEFADERNCGRPLGMRLDKDKYLVVADSYKGLFRVNVATGDYHPYFTSDLAIDGAKPMFLNDLDIDDDGMIYVTDSSTKWSRNQFTSLLAEGDTTGRLIKYDPVKETTEVLMRGLHFPNGVQLSRTKDYLLVCETGYARIWKYHLKGPNAGQSEVFADNLPGYPDNVRLSTSGGFWVGMAFIRNPDAFNIFEFFQERPWLRSFMSRAFRPETVLKYTANLGKGLLVQMNNQGEVTRTLHDPTGGVVKSISEVHDHNGVLYIGSFKAPFLGKLDIRQN